MRSIAKTTKRKKIQRLGPVQVIRPEQYDARSGPRFLDSSISEISAFPYATCCVLRSAKYTVSGVCRFNV